MPHPPSNLPLGAIDTGEFTRADDAADVAARHLGRAGVCYGSMSLYQERYPEHLVVKNANVATIEHGKVWWGDLDCARMANELRALARELGVRVYVLPEAAARFRHALAPRFEESLYSTDGSDVDVVSTRTWLQAAFDEQRREAQSRPGRLELRFAHDGASWAMVGADGELRQISATEARRVLESRGQPWDPAWDDLAAP